MSFVPNKAWNEQTSLYDSYSVLTERSKKFLNRSWAKYFAEEIFPRIEEEPYRVLYSSKDSRPNTPVNVQIGALILKELTGLSDEELMNEMMFDVRYQYALHTTGYAEQPMSDRTLGRFRERCSTYDPITVQGNGRVDAGGQQSEADGQHDGGIEYQADEPAGIAVYVHSEPGKRSREARKAARRVGALYAGR